MFFEIVKFIVYSSFIVLISKYILVTTLRKLAESLDLKPRTVGKIAGCATSIPELLTISISSFNGFISASIVNIISSNIINFIQYISSIYLNNNQKILKNKAITIDILLIICTIIIPIVLSIFEVEINIYITPVFIILYVLFNFLNKNANKLYLKKENEILQVEIEKEQKWERKNKKKLIKYTVYLILIGVLLFGIGDALGKVLESLCNIFNISETIIGILLGVVTSIPELITFFESQKHYIKEKNDKVLGVVEATNNLFTSNMLNLFIIQSIGVLIYTFF